MSGVPSFLDTVLDSQDNFEDLVEYKDEELLEGPELNIIEFTESPKGLHLELRPTQRVILKLLYGVPLSTVIPDEPENTPPLYSRRILVRHPVSGQVNGPFSEVQYLEFLREEGRTNGIEGKEYTSLILNIGRRGGKSTLSTVISSYEIYRLLRKRCPQRHYGIRDNAVIRVIVVGTDKSQSEDLFSDISSFSSSSPYLRKYLSDDIKSEITFFTPYDFQKANRSGTRIKPTLLIKPVSCNAPAVRGPNTIDGIMDECAHMMDSTSKKASANSVYEALEPSVSTFYDGKMILISTPNGPQGFFYDIFTMAAQEGDDSDILVIKAPTWEINPGRVTDVKYRNKWKLDKNSFRQEYGADFTSTVRDYIEDPDMFFKNIYPIPGVTENEECKLPEQEPAEKGQQGIDYYFAADLGFKQDSTCFAIGHAEGDGEDKKIVVDYVAEYQPGEEFEWTNDQGVISFEKMSKETVDLTESFNIVKGAFDQHHGPAYSEHLLNNGITNFVELPPSDKLHNDVYQVFRRLYQEERLVLPGYDWIIDGFLDLIMVKKGVGDKEKIKVAATRGKHDDVPDAISRLVYLIFKEVYLKEGVGAKVSKPVKTSGYRVVTDLRHNRNLLNKHNSNAVDSYMRKQGHSNSRGRMKRRF